VYVVRVFGQYMSSVLKREVSQSIANLQHSVKRLAIDNERTYMISPEPQHPPRVETVLSTSRDDFDSVYDILSEIGRGGFSVVYQCRHKESKEIFAVKVVIVVASEIYFFKKNNHF
jgi:hypothetical protein